MTIRLLLGDCRDVLKTLPDASVDSIVTDPPYELTSGKKGGTGAGGFMGMAWDATGVAFDVATWLECLRVLKPGGHMLAFSGTRTYHRMVCAIEDAGFEIRDQIGWLFGSGFPKSLDVGKAIDKAAGAEREVISPPPYTRGKPTQRYSETRKVSYDCAPQPITAPATNAARQWQGWGTALKPAWEPICVARKPLIGTVAANVLAHGTGALNIDGCRVASDETTVRAVGKSFGLLHNDGRGKPGGEAGTYGSDVGRWPANLIHDGSDEVLAAFPQAPGQIADVSDTAPSAKTGRVYGPMARTGEPSADSENAGAVGFKMKPGARRGDSGSAARFFYCSKASPSDRGPDNTHPTVKPTDLMRYLCRLVTPPGGVVLDPFMGSGSTLKAAELEGFSAIGIELSAEYIEIARRRITADAPLFTQIEAAA